MNQRLRHSGRRILPFFCPVFILGAGLIAISEPANAALPGFTLNGTNWTYEVAGQRTISGILLKPDGDGPFPAVVISHGRSSTPLAFTSGKAQEMVAWGLVCIGPIYTDPDYSASEDGARTENMRRAHACVEILNSLSYVDPGRIAAYGNSMGAFVTIQLSADSPKEIMASAITAGGISPSGDWPSPNVAEAEPIRSPFLILHGSADTTVFPALSESLKAALDSHNVPNLRIVYDGINHNLHSVLPDEVYYQIQAWFTNWGLFTPVNPAEIWVDFANESVERGTELQPFSTLTDALPAVQSAGIVKILSGASGETLAINQAARLEAVNGAVRIGAGAASFAGSIKTGAPARVFDWAEY